MQSAGVVKHVLTTGGSTARCRVDVSTELQLNTKLIYSKVLLVTRPFEIQATCQVYSCHVVVYRNANVFFQPDECVEGSYIFSMNCTGPMMNVHFDPLIPVTISFPTSTITDQPN